MKWITNSLDYRQQIRRSSLFIFLPIGYSRDEADHIKTYMEWFNSFIIGPPKGTEVHSSEYLAKQGLVGLYRKQSREEWIEEELRRLSPQKPMVITSEHYSDTSDIIVEITKIKYY